MSDRCKKEIKNVERVATRGEIAQNYDQNGASRKSFVTARSSLPFRICLHVCESFCVTKSHGNLGRFQLPCSTPYVKSRRSCNDGKALGMNKQDPIDPVLGRD